jgi:hypothetical protein
MNKKLVVATYEDLESAQKVVSGLIEANFHRNNIYVARRPEHLDLDTPPQAPAVYEGTEWPHALVAMTVLEDQLEYAQDIMMQRCTPIFVETGEAPWNPEDWRDLIPHLDEFTPVSLDFGDVESRERE